MIKIYKSRLVCKTKILIVVDKTSEPHELDIMEILYYKVQIRILFLWITIKTFIDIDDPEFAKNEAEEFLDKYNEVI